MPEIPEPLEDAAMFAARQAQQQASPLQQSPWLSRLVGSVVRSTLELAVEQLKPEIKLPDREALAFTLFATDNRNAAPEIIRADYARLRAEQAAAGEPFYCDPLADAAIEAFRLANR